VVPIAVLVYVLPRTPKVAAVPRDGVVAARAETGPDKTNARASANIVNAIFLSNFFIGFNFFVLIKLDK
jgi:hypothetical protein